ncbi:MAG: glycosyltransferase family 2 protein [Candidatus Pacebacteria bacterium]|nr:glycosyltransferase family 2 protein [Candidatus Paceibacterota bacterium]
MKKKILSLIILSYNTKKILQDCLGSLRKASVPGGYLLEIIVVDNGSVDGSAAWLQNWASRSLTNRFVREKKNLGFALGNNHGLKIASGDFVMLLNSDTIVRKDVFEKLVFYLEKNPRIGAVSPLLLLPDGQPQNDYYFRFPNLWQLAFYHQPLLRPLVMKTPLKWLVVSRGKTMTDRLKPPVQDRITQLAFEVDQLPGAALLVRRKVWNKVGGLDSDYHFLFEDVDWCWRARIRGFKLAVVPEAKITHLGGASWKKKLQKNKNQFYYQYFASMLLFVNKHYSFFASWVFFLSILVNFLTTFKWILAWDFLKNQGKQKKLWV